MLYSLYLLYEANYDGLDFKSGFHVVESAEKCFQTSTHLIRAIDNLFSYLKYSWILYNTENIDCNIYMICQMIY